MAQVAARITPEREQWLKQHFRTKSAGAEFLLPWALGTLANALHLAKMTFIPKELKAIVEAHRENVIAPERAKSAYLELWLEMSEADEHLLGKVRSLDDVQAAAITIWATAFWTARDENVTESLDEYVSN